MNKDILVQLKKLGAADCKAFSGSEEEYIIALKAFLAGQDFLKLGHSINGKQWSSAMMNVRRLRDNCKKLGIGCFDKWLMGIRDAVIRQNAAEALQIMTQITAKRVQLRNILAEDDGT